jgi:hypothetical protein
MTQSRYWGAFALAVLSLVFLSLSHPGAAQKETRTLQSSS